MLWRHHIRRILSLVWEYWLFIVILIVGAYVWSNTFQTALADYMSSEVWRYRHVWMGNGQTELFGYTVSYMMEGYSDYSFYYVHWGHNMLRGVMPYMHQFGYIELDGFVNENGVYIFPPLTACLYAVGILIAPGNWGIGLLITMFGFLTVFPVYGIAKSLSNNRHVGEAAALTYLFNPIVLYHTAFTWLNPAPFVFFFFAGFYALVRGRRNVGSLLIVTAALFKQTAWFLGIALAIFLLLKWRDLEKPLEEFSFSGTEFTGFAERFRYECKKRWHIISHYFDITGLLTSICIILLYVGAIVFPFLLAQPNMIRFMSLPGRGWPLESFTEPPGYSSPIRIQVLPVVAGLPELAQLLEWLVLHHFLLVFGTVVISGIMFIHEKDTRNKNSYFRQLLFMTMILMLWVTLTGPRGVYKYYFVVFAPFFSIFSSTKMIRSREDSVSFSLSMLYVPALISLLVLIPHRNVYLFGVILITVGFILADSIGSFWALMSAPFRVVGRWVFRTLHTRINSARCALGRFHRSVSPSNECA